jgi:hypothetical protein
VDAAAVEAGVAGVVVCERWEAGAPVEGEAVEAEEVAEEGGVVVVVLVEEDCQRAA